MGPPSTPRYRPWASCGRATCDCYGALASSGDIRILLRIASPHAGATMPRCRTRRSTSPTETCPSISAPRSLPATTSRPHRRGAPSLRRGRGGPRERASTRSSCGSARARAARSDSPGSCWASGSTRRPAASRPSASTAAGRASSSSTSSAARTARWSMPRASRPAGAATSASANISYGEHRQASRPSRSSRSLEELRERIPPQLFDMVAGSAQQPAVEDLDI